MGGRGGEMSREKIQVHFVHDHVWDKIVIPKEGKFTHPCFPDCDMFLPWAYLNLRHSDTYLCEWG